MIDYSHVKCECGGIIGMYNRRNFTCDKCGKQFDSYRISYDVMLTNDKTGWIFPMTKRRTMHNDR